MYPNERTFRRSSCDGEFVPLGDIGCACCIWRHSGRFLRSSGHEFTCSRCALVLLAGSLVTLVHHDDAVAPRPFCLVEPRVGAAQ
jgi:hypothetical protein